MASHHQLTVLQPDEARAVRFDPNARTYEAFRLGRNEKGQTHLLEPLSATSLNDALAEATSRWGWDRGDRLGVREFGHRIDRLHVYAARRKSAANYVYRDYAQHREHARWIEHICTIDLNIIGGIDVIGVGSERAIFEHNHQRRPAGARQ